KNMCGYIKLQLYATENVDVIVKEIKLSTKQDGQLISGDFYISKDNDEEEEYSLKMYEASQEHSAQSGSVILDCSAQQGGGVTLGSQSEPTIFYIAVPAQTYSNGFQITVTDIYGRDITKGASAPFTLERSHIKPMAALEIDMNSVITIETDENGNAYVTADANENIFPIEKFLKWGYLVNHCNYELGIKLTGNVNMPEYEIEADHVNKTYKITDTDITVTDGTPSGSNWVPLGKIGSSSSDLSTSFKGKIDGQNHTISGLFINNTTSGTGLVGCFSDGTINNITIDNAKISGKDFTGGIVGYNRYNTKIENISITNSNISGTSKIGGIVGQHYRRRQYGNNQVHELLPIIIKCKIDENSVVTGTSDCIGGICGYSYGAAVIECTNNADITGSTNVGGIVGYHREYDKTHVNSYIIACSSREEATITATNGNGIGGGVLGYSASDPTNHPLAISYTIACYSLSEISAQTNTKGSLIGDTHTGNCHIIASWAKKTDNVHNVINGSGTRIASEHFTTSNEVTEEFVSQMNTAIEAYNNSVIDEEGDAVADIIKCHYKWQYDAGGWPTLVESPVSSNP
ncbi:MAG: hypothetical protein IKA38_08960, partial [Alistipes sp.]|nr:hypothetical protein [Alistipes sp.]